MKLGIFTSYSCSNGYEMYKKKLFCSINLLYCFFNVLVAVAVAVVVVSGTPYCLIARVKLVPSIACLFFTLLTDDRHLTKKATDNKVGIFCKGILSLISVF